MLFELVQRFTKLFYVGGMECGHGVDGSRGWKGLKMVTCKGSDRWLMKPLRPAATFESNASGSYSSSIKCVSLSHVFVFVGEILASLSIRNHFDLFFPPYIFPVFFKIKFISRYVRRKNVKH